MFGWLFIWSPKSIILKGISNRNVHFLKAVEIVRRSDVTSFKWYQIYIPWKDLLLVGSRHHQVLQSHTKTMLPMRRSMPRSNRQWATQRPDDRKEVQNCGGMDMSPVYQVWPKPSCKAQWKEEEDKADRRSRKTASGNGQAWSQVPEGRGKWRKMVMKSSVVPQRPSQLRNKWGVSRTEVLCSFFYSEPPKHAFKGINDGNGQLLDEI